MLLFTILMSGGHQGGHLGVYSTLKLRVNSVKNRKNAKFQSKIDVQVSTLVSTRHQNCKKQHLSFHWKKKLSSYLFLLVFQLYKRTQLENCWIFSDLRATMRQKVFPQFMFLVKIHQNFLTSRHKPKTKRFFFWLDSVRKS